MSICDQPCAPLPYYLPQARLHDELRKTKQAQEKAERKAMALEVELRRGEEKMDRFQQEMDFSKVRAALRKLEQ